MHERKAVVIPEEDFSAVTVLKPFSDEYLNFLIVVHEDAYGEVMTKLTLKSDLKKRLKFTDEEFEAMLARL